MRFALLVFALVSGTPVGAAEPLAAWYLLRSQSGGEERVAEFVLVRTDTLVEVQDSVSGFVERWERDPTGRIFYSRLFLDAAKAIEFQPADLAAAGVSSDWETIRSVLPADLLGRLEATGSGKTLGLRTARYRGVQDGSSVKVDWLPAESLPARVQRRNSDSRSDLKLQQIERGDDALAELTSAARLQSFEHIDFADLGDREGDPVLESLLMRSGLDLHEH